MKIPTQLFRDYIFHKPWNKDPYYQPISIMEGHLGFWTVLQVLLRISPKKKTRISGAPGTHQQDPIASYHTSLMGFETWCHGVPEFCFGGWGSHVLLGIPGTFRPWTCGRVELVEWMMRFFSRFCTKPIGPKKNTILICVGRWNFREVVESLWIWSVLSRWFSMKT